MKKKSVFLVIALFMVVLAVVQAQDRGDGWPPANILRQFGIEGMPLPAGVDSGEIFWRSDLDPSMAGYMLGDLPHLYINLVGDDAIGAPAIKTWFERNGWRLVGDRNDVFKYVKGKAAAYFDFEYGTGQIVAGFMEEDFTDEYWD